MIKVQDDQLVKNLIEDKDEASFCELINRYSEKVHNLALRITRSPEDTEEIIQDVFVTVYNKIDKFEGKSAFSSWLYRITVNTAFMKLRKRRQNAAISMEEISPNIKNNWIGTRSEQSDMNFITSKHEMRAALELAISKLPDEYRTIFLLRDVDGLSNQEVGQVLKITVPAVKSRLHRSRLMLRKSLQRFYDDYRCDYRIYYSKKAPMVELNQA